MARLFFTQQLARFTAVPQVDKPTVWLAPGAPQAVVDLVEGLGGEAQR